ncbi:MAG: hypothetical protein RQ826_17300, partial [Xanthomonadales bacterium]|nr:hypothetical protein [Xanthomonadales bacterium]
MVFSESTGCGHHATPDAAQTAGDHQYLARGNRMNGKIIASLLYIFCAAASTVSVAENHGAAVSIAVHGGSGTIER